MMLYVTILTSTILKTVSGETTGSASGTCTRINEVKDQRRGSALIGLVAAIVLLSVLAAAIIPMVSSSGQQTALVDQASKAFLLAESGYRLAASRFLHAGGRTEDQHQLLEQLDGNYTLDSNQGRFELQVFAYFFEVINDTISGTTSLKAHCPGTLPDQNAFPDDPDDEIQIAQGLKVRIADQTYTLGIGSAAKIGEDDNVTFVFDGPLPFLPAGTVIYPVATADEGQTPTLTHGGTLAYESDTADMFPLRNGKILIDDLTLTYRFNDRTNNRLVDIQNPNDTDMVHTLSQDAEIMLARYVRLHATGIFGDAESGAHRQVVYYTPLPLEDLATRQESFTDKMDDTINFTGVSGTHAAADAGGNSALKVEGTVTVGDDKGSLIQFDPKSEAAQKINFNAARRATRGYLNYDTQIKIGFEAQPQPTLGYSPYRPIPAHVAAGLSFRLSGTNTEDASTEDLFESNGYGLSILRGNNSIDSAIPDEIIPLPDTRMLVLWQQTDNGATRAWLAHKELPVVVEWTDDLEGTANWNLDPQPLPEINLWNTASQPATPHSGSVAWHFGREPSPGIYTYQPEPPLENSASRGGIISDPISVCDAPQVSLTFWSWHRTEDEDLTRDLKQIRILVDGDLEAEFRINRIGNQAFWYREQFDLTQFAGETIQVVFYFDSIDGSQNNFAGWMIDDVQILCEDWPLQNATVGVRLREAMVVRFKNGQVEIRQGDRIQGSLNNTIGTVIAPPLLTSGSWGGDPAAAGALLLNRTTKLSLGDAFQTDEPIAVIGNTGKAEVATWDQINDSKANVIQVFYASQNGFGGGDTDPLNRITQPYGRLGVVADPTELQWPPHLDSNGIWTDEDGNWTPAEDYFRLVRWDAVNDANVTGLSTIDFVAQGQGLIENAIIQSHYHQSDSDTLQTPDFPTLFNQPELGLHTFGDGSENVFFDDFGIRLDVAQDDILLPPLQQ